MTFTGANIASTYNRSFQVQLPSMKISNVDLPISAGILKHPVELQCLGCSTAPAGMTGVTNPFQVNIINRQSAKVM